MATYGNYFSIPGLSASTAITQYRIVKMASTAGQVINVAATTDRPVGVIQNDPATNEIADIAHLGIAKVLAGTSTITAGENLGFDSTGRVMDHTTDNRASIGLALEASSAANDIIRVLLNGFGRY